MAAMKRAEASTGQLSGASKRNLQQVGASMQNVGRTATTFITVPLVAMAGFAVKAASDLNESMSKVNVVFGDSAQAVTDWSETSAEAFGQSQQQALEAAGTFGNLFTAMGLGQEEAATMSMGLVQLASDLASFNNVPIEEALIALRAGLVGEIEPMRRFGVQINAATVEAKAMEMGLVDASGEVTEAGKVQARYALILEQTTTAQGDFARTSDGLANKSRTLTASFTDLAAEIGGILMPIALGLVGAVSGLVSVFTDLPGPVQTVMVALGGVAAVAGPLIFIAGSLVKNLVAIQTAMKLVSGTRIAGSLGMASKALGALGIAAVAGFAAYQLFTSKQRETTENTRESTQALDDQFPSLMLAALAAAEASGEIDAVAVANEALSQSLADGNDRLTTALAALNVSSDQMLDFLVLLESGGQDAVGAIDFLSRSFGLNAEQADFVARNWQQLNSINASTREGMLQAAEALGITREQMEELAPAIMEVFRASETSDPQAVARAFLDLQVAAHGYEDSLVAAAEANLGFTRQTGDALLVYQEYARLVAEATPAQLEAAGITEQMAAAMAALDPAAAAAALGIEDVAGAVSGQNLVMSDAIDLTSNLADMYAFAEQQQAAWLDVIDRTINPLMELEDAKQALWAAGLGFTDAIDEESRSVEFNSEAGLQNRGVIQDWAQDIIDHTRVLIQNGVAADTVSNDYQHNRDALLDAAEAAGFNRDEVDALISSWGLVPDLVVTTYGIKNLEDSKRILEEYIDEIGGIPPEVATEVETLVNQGKYDEALALLFALENPLVTPLDVIVRSIETVVIQGQEVQIARRGSGHFFAAEGGFYDSPVIAGEAGMEGIFPFTKPNRLDSMLSDPRSAPLWAAMGRLTGGGQSAGGDINVYVTNNGRDLTGDDIARAIVRHRVAA